jgi:hypothetical protein
VYGAIVVLPKLGVPYPFPVPHKEVPVIFGEFRGGQPGRREWLNANEKMIVLLLAVVCSNFVRSWSRNLDRFLW